MIMYFLGYFRPMCSKTSSFLAICLSVSKVKIKKRHWSPPWANILSLIFDRKENPLFHLKGYSRRNTVEYNRKKL